MACASRLGCSMSGRIGGSRDKVVLLLRMEGRDLACAFASGNLLHWKVKVLI